MGARSVGHYRLAPGFGEPPRLKHFVQVFWCVSGSGLIYFDGNAKEFAPGQIAVYLPGMVHQVQALDEYWEYRWWTMDGPLAATNATAMGLAAGIYSVGTAPHKLLDKLQAAIQDVSRAGELHAGAVAYEMLSLAAAGKNTETERDNVIEKITEKIQQEWNNPDIGVDLLAAEYGMHRSSLSRRFKAAVGLSPVEYLTNLRVQNALSRLKQTDATVAEVAFACGYRDPNYFSRLLKRKFGLSPMEFRKQS